MIRGIEDGHVVIDTDFTPEEIPHITQGLIHTMEAALMTDTLTDKGHQGIMSTLRLLTHMLPTEDQSITLLSGRMQQRK